MTKVFQQKKRIFAALLAGSAVILAFRLFGPWEKLFAEWDKSPAPYHFVSLRNCSDDQIARFMSGAKRVDSFHEEGSPDSNFPEPLWKTDPKTAALAFAEANRSPTHRKNFQLWVDSNPSLTAPDAGWLVFDDFSGQTVLRFGVGQPFLLHAATSSLGMASNRYVDGEKHEQQLIPLSSDEARFLAHTSFWLEHLKSMPTNKNYHPSSIHSSHESFGTLEWEIDKQGHHQIQGTLWGAIADRWRGDYNEEAQVNLAHYLLSEALPKHLGKRWEKPTRITYDSHNLPLAERLKPQNDPASQAKLTQIILTALARHETEPLPAKGLIALASCAGDAGLIATLPAWESLNAKLPPPTADEIEFTTLNAQFRFTYPAPTDPDERKKWQRHEALETALKHDFLTQVRPPLTQAIRQLHSIGQPARLRELAESKDDSAMWALRQLYQLQPDAYAEVLIRRFSTDDPRFRRSTFETLANVNPAAAGRLRDSLTDNEQAELLFEITDFERSDDPSRAQTRVSALLKIVEQPTEKILANGNPSPSQRREAITQLAKLPLNPADQKRFEGLLVNELLFPETLEIYGKCAISAAADAIVVQPNPDRFWDALYAAASAESGHFEFHSLIDALTTLALAKPQPQLSQIAELLRPRLRKHEGQIERLFPVIHALDLQSLKREIEFLATSGPIVADGEVTNSCKNDPDTPCLHRYHSARHISALWQEPDVDTRARMWTALVINSPYDFSGTGTIPSCLRDRCRSAIAAASPEIYQQLVAKARATSDLPREISEWLAGFP